MPQIDLMENAIPERDLAIKKKNILMGKAHDYNPIFDNYMTPKKFFDELDKEFHFMLDAATNPDNPLKTPKFYTKKDNGLLKNWINTTWCNPPYSSGMRNFVAKARYEQRRGITSVLLLPVKTDANWFHDYIYMKPDVEIRFVKGRMQFFNSETKEWYSASFPNMVVIFRAEIPKMPTVKGYTL